ncbi:6-phosphogluconolactonase [Oxalobacteraceae bacterium GrIS 2.11]
MQSLSLKFKLSTLVASCGLALAVLSAPVIAHEQFAGVVYTMSNAVSGNAVIAFNRTRDGALITAGQYNTGGSGSGTGLGSQGSVSFDRSGRWLFVVNAGSNDLSVFASDDDGLQLTDKQATGGKTPVSVTEHHGLVYVLNAGDSTVSGFWLTRQGKLKSIAGSTVSLGSNVGGAQVSFSPDGDQLVVTEKASGNIVIYAVADDGKLSPASTYASPTPTPYGFDFGRHHEFFVSEAAGGAPNASSVSSYVLDGDTANIVSKSIATQYTAACWLIATRDGRFIYTSDAASGVLSGYAVSKDGHIKLLNSNGQTALIGAGTHPIDLAQSRGSEYLYSLNNGNSTISGFRINQNGSLGVVGSTSGVPLTAQGLAAK